MQNNLMRIGIFLGIFFAVAIAVLSAEDTAKAPGQYLNIIVFEDRTTKNLDNEKKFELIELPSNEFPARYSQLFAPQIPIQYIKVPQGVVIPEKPAFVDTYTIKISEEQLTAQERHERNNDLLTKLNYGIKLISWSDGHYQAELDGSYGRKKFGTIPISAAIDKTVFVKIRHSSKRTVYFVLTPLSFPAFPGKDEINGFRPISIPLPEYPKELRHARRQSELVTIAVKINKEGNIVQNNFIITECTHPLFAYNALKTVLSQWKFQPALKEGIPVEVDIFLGISFNILR